MGHELKSLFRVETKRLIWLMGVTFAVIIAFQYLELPYGNVFSSLFPSSKVTVAGTSAGAPSSDTHKIANATQLSGLNSTGTHAINETAPDAGTSEGKDKDLIQDIVSETNVGLNKSKSSEFDEDSKFGKETLTQNLEELNNNSIVDHAKASNNKNAAEENSATEQSFSLKNDTTYSSSSNHSIGEVNITSLVSPLPSLPPSDSSTIVTLGNDVDTNIRNPVISINSSTPAVTKDAILSFDKNKNPVDVQTKVTPSGDDSRPETSASGVITIAEMNSLLHTSHDSYSFAAPRWSSAVDQELLYARTQIENAPIIKNDAELYAPLYRNISMFKRSYQLMEEKLKVYVYKEGKRPILHQPFLKGIYASEGWFMKQLETNKKFVTKKPREAHLFYLPFSSRMLEETLYVRDSHSHKNLIQYLKDYVDMISAKYPFWNRTEGADHFLVACHDWAPSETRKYMANCIRALCNSDVKEGYVFGKDVSLPETYIRFPQNPLRGIGGKPLSKRSFLVFFAGSMHGYLRPILLEQWGNKDPDMKIFGKMPKVKGKMDYVQYMKSSKYCLCPRGYEVNSPRVVEAIFYGCVPVIISDNFVPPFFEILNWESFAVFILEKDIPNLKNILLSIREKRYRQMQLRVKKVQQHFLWHPKPEKYDTFHMILHSVWYNRVFQIKPT